MHTICIQYDKYDINMQEICKKIEEICKKYVGKYAGNVLNMHEICMKYAWNMHEICIKYAYNMQEIWQIWHKYANKYAGNMQ